MQNLSPESLYRIMLTKCCIVEKLVCFFCRGDLALARSPKAKSLAILSTLLKDDSLVKADYTT
jgi:hypothetical protein